MIEGATGGAGTTCGTGAVGGGGGTQTAGGGTGGSGQAGNVIIVIYLVSNILVLAYYESDLSFLYFTCLYLSSFCMIFCYFFVILILYKIFQKIL